MNSWLRKLRHLFDFPHHYKIFFILLHQNEDEQPLKHNFFVIKIIRIIKIFVVSTRKFLADDCLSKGSSVAYTTLVSLIPTLTVLLTFFSIFSGVANKKDELFQTISVFLVEHSIKLNVEPFFDVISSLIDNAAKIGGIGAIITVFSATAILKTIDQSLNDIHKVKNQRPFLLKIIYYWAVLTLGPILLISGTALVAQITEVLSPAKYTSLAVSKKNEIWITGTKGQILIQENEKSPLLPLDFQKLDFDNQAVFDYNLTAREFQLSNFKTDETFFRRLKFNKVRFFNQTGLILGKDGILLRTSNAGKNFQIYKLGSFNLNDAVMPDEDTIIVAADNGNLLISHDDGISWSIKEWQNLPYHIKSMALFKNSIYAVGERGLLVYSNDGGENFKTMQIDSARRNKRYINLNDIQVLDETHIWVSGQEGVLLHSADGGRNWIDKKFLLGNYLSICFYDKNSGFISSDDGVIFQTHDQGEKWNKIKLSRNSINQLIYNENKKTFWLAGDNGMLYSTSNHWQNWTGRESNLFLLGLLNFFTPFLFIWFFFLLIYKVFPNIRIPFKDASIGAAFTSIVWVIFIFLFVAYIKLFVDGTIAVYGALAAIPIFLLLVYSSALIILYGAQVSYVLSHRYLYLNLKKTLNSVKEVSVSHGLLVLYYIYSRFEGGKGATTIQDLYKLIPMNSEETDFFIELFNRENLITENTAGFLPLNHSANIPLEKLLELIHQINYSIPVSNLKDHPFRDFISGIFADLKRLQHEPLKDLTLQDLIMQKKK